MFQVHKKLPNNFSMKIPFFVQKWGESRLEKKPQIVLKAGHFHKKLSTHSIAKFLTKKSLLLEAQQM